MKFFGLFPLVSRLRFLGLAVGLATLLSLLSGCAMFHGWGMVGNGGQTNAGAAISVPLGK
jgi:hypothetical protein